MDPSQTSHTVGPLSRHENRSGEKDVSRTLHTEYKAEHIRPEIPVLGASDVFPQALGPQVADESIVQLGRDFSHQPETVKGDLRAVKRIDRHTGKVPGLSVVRRRGLPVGGGKAEGRPTAGQHHRGVVHTQCRDHFVMTHPEPEWSHTRERRPATPVRSPSVKDRGPGLRVCTR